MFRSLLIHRWKRGEQQRRRYLTYTLVTASSTVAAGFKGYWI